MLFFFFKQKTAYEMRISDWSSDVCSSDLLIVGDARMFAHDGALHDALAVDHAAEPARPGGVDQCVGHRAAIDRRDIAAEQDAVIGDDDAERRVELTETAQHPVLPRILVFTGDTHRETRRATCRERRW